MPGVFLGFDFGTVRIGTAVGNALTGGARPLEIISAQRREEKWRRIAELAAEWRPEALVVGLPRHGDGTPNATTPRALRFARQLEGRLRLPVYMADERYSSVTVEAGRADPVDADSAAVILQQWMDEGMPKNTPSAALPEAQS